MRERAAPQGREEVDGVVDEEGVGVGERTLVGRLRRKKRPTRGGASGGLVEVSGEEAAERRRARRHGAGGSVAGFLVEQVVGVDGALSQCHGP